MYTSTAYESAGLTFIFLGIPLGVIGIILGVIGFAIYPWLSIDEPLTSLDVDTPIGPRNFNRQFAIFAKRAGLEDVHVHTCRHFCATQLGELGLEERVIGAILGHTAQVITAHYAKATLPMMRAALDTLAIAFFRKAA